MAKDTFIIDSVFAPYVRLGPKVKLEVQRQIHALEIRAAPTLEDRRELARLKDLLILSRPGGRDHGNA